MSIYALADLHLSLSCPDKSMEVFGLSWGDYISKVRENWEKVVKDTDTVLIPGDISWATYIDKAGEDFRFISELPGRKLLCRGNHDYWWTTIKKMEEFLASKGLANMEFVRTNVIPVEDAIVTGTRGWMIETKESLEGSDNRKIYEREKLRIKMCIDELVKADPEHGKKHIMMIHYPPVTSRMDFTEFADMMAEGGIDICVYGHLHGTAHKKAYEGEYKGMKLICSSADYVGFKPVRGI